MRAVFVSIPCLGKGHEGGLCRLRDEAAVEMSLRDGGKVLAKTFTSDRRAVVQAANLADDCLLSGGEWGEARSLAIA